MVELAFIAANKKGLEKGLRGLMTRTQLTESLLRLCSTWMFNLYGYNQVMSDHIDEFY